MKLKKENIPFTMVANEVLKDKNLSFKAKGMYAYLFSKPDKWDFSSNRMILETKDGRKSIMKMLLELEENGYLQREKLSNGKMEYTLKYGIKSLSTEKELRVEKPKSPFGTVPKRLGAKSSPISNTEDASNTEKKVIHTTGIPDKEFSLIEEIQRMEENPRRDINIIALYFDKRMPDIRNKDQLTVAIRRHLRAAGELKPFTDNQIIDAIPKARQLTEGWTLETLTKILTK